MSLLAALPLQGAGVANLKLSPRLSRLHMGAQPPQLYLCCFMLASGHSSSGNMAAAAGEARANLVAGRPAVHRASIKRARD